MNDNLIEIKDLTIHHVTSDGTYKAVNDVSLNIGRTETLGLVGETGAGKTTTALSLLNLIPDPPEKSFPARSSMTARIS